MTLARNRIGGFTLLELVVATSLLALLSLTMLIGMRVGFGAWQRGERRIEMVAQEEAVQEYFSRAMASAVPYVAAAADENLPRQFLPFQGNRQGMRWLTTYSTAWRERSGLTLVECFSAGEGDQRQLVVQEFPVRGDAVLVRQMVAAVRTDADTNRPTIVYRPVALTDAARVLVTGLRDARFEFLNVTAKGSTWQADWDAVQEKQLPAAVRVLIQTSTGERKWTVRIHNQIPVNMP